MDLVEKNSVFFRKVRYLGDLNKSTGNECAVSIAMEGRPLKMHNEASPHFIFNTLCGIKLNFGRIVLLIVLMFNRFYPE